MQPVQRADLLRAGWLGALAGLAVGCSVDVPDVDCTRPADCGGGMICVRGLCVAGDAGGPGDSGDSGDSGGDGPIVWALDPAPGRDDTGEYACEGGPDADFDVFVTIRPGPANLWLARGNIQGATDNGTWYARSEEGWEQLGDVVTDPSTGDFEVPVPTSCGDTGEPGRETLVKLLWPGDACEYLAVLSIQTEYCLTDDLQVTLYWNPAGENLDLHLVRPGGQLNDPVDDCNSWTCVGISPEWGVPGTADDPRKSQDSETGAIPEGIFLADAEDGVYTVFVERGDGAAAAPSDAVVIVTAGGRATASQVSAVPLRHVWQAATIEWPSGRVTPVETVHDCRADWGATGCELPLPE